MFQSTIYVFREIVQANQVLFQHYRAAREDEDGYLVEDSLLDELSHYELLEQD